MISKDLKVDCIFFTLGCIAKKDHAGLGFSIKLIGGSVGKGLISLGLGLLVAYVGTGEDIYPRLSMGTETLARGFPVVAVVLGVLILGEVFRSLEDL